MMDARTTLKQWLTAGRLPAVFTGLTALIEQIGDRDFGDTVTHQASRFHGLQRDYRQGVITQEHHDQQTNLLRRAVAELINELPEGTQFPPDFEPPAETQVEHFPVTDNNGVSTYWKVGAVILLLGLVGWLWRGLPGDEPFEFTINVNTAEKVSDHYPTLTGGTLQLFVDNKWETATLDTDGLADFKSLPGTLRARTVAVRLRAPFWELAADSVTLEDRSQTLTAVPDGKLGTLSGTVYATDGTTPLSGVILTTDSTRDTTRTDGSFTLFLPTEEQRTERTIKLVKPGFQSSSERVTLDGGRLEFRLREL